ncbi:LOW QUALITY PROTEIN: hypothetical protein QYF61_008873 [Mycteria americana]|uniref:Uncharacterized protein n=1 Tax=Mycteria americana TaxID=33587 RepID=A0AAN7N706_MYCAM|nr:LOW QUALITY PROTEIN: hypothetical protein QYF61_008873 [Mycteria americana]
MNLSCSRSGDVTQLSSQGSTRGDCLGALQEEAKQEKEGKGSVVYAAHQLRRHWDLMALNYKQWETIKPQPNPSPIGADPTDAFSANTRPMVQGPIEPYSPRTGVTQNLDQAATGFVVSPNDSDTGAYPDCEYRWGPPETHLHKGPETDNVGTRATAVPVPFDTNVTLKVVPAQEGWPKVQREQKGTDSNVVHMEEDFAAAVVIESYSWFLWKKQVQRHPKSRASKILKCPMITDHRITESQNRIGWKRPLRSSSPTINLTLPSPPLHHVPKHLIQTAFKYLQGWGLHHFPGQPVPMLDNPFSEEKFPNIQSKPPLAQLEAISSRPITCDLGEETDPTSLQPPFRQFDEVSPQPPLLQAEQPQVPQPLPISLVLQTLPQLRCPSLDTLQPLNVSLGVRGPTLNTAFEVRPHQCRVQGHNHCPSPAGHAISDTSQDARCGITGRRLLESMHQLGSRDQRMKTCGLGCDSDSSKLSSEEKAMQQLGRWLTWQI